LMKVVRCPQCKLRKTYLSLVVSSSTSKRNKLF
jgi:hypothetical protein